MKPTKRYDAHNVTLNALEISRKSESWLKDQIRKQSSMKFEAEKVPELQAEIIRIQNQYDCLKGAIMDALTEGQGNRRTLAFALQCAEGLDSDPMLMELATLIYTQDSASVVAALWKPSEPTQEHAEPDAGKSSEDCS